VAVAPKPTLIYTGFIHPDKTNPVMTHTVSLQKPFVNTGVDKWIKAKITLEQPKYSVTVKPQ
jgi:hypothetical protein